MGRGCHSAQRSFFGSASASAPVRLSCWNQRTTARSRRGRRHTIKRVPLGQPDSSTRSVSSATAAPARSLPSWRSAGRQSSSSKRIRPLPPTRYGLAARRAWGCCAWGDYDALVTGSQTLSMPERRTREAEEEGEGRRRATEPERPVVTVITNGNVFSNMALRPLMMGVGDSYSVNVVMTSGLRKPEDSRMREAVRLASRWGPRYTLYKAFTTLVPPVADRLVPSTLTVGSTCRALGVEAVALRNVNDSEGTSYLRSVRPDLLVSYSCPYRLGAQVLETARIGSLNVHSSLLPRYAGVCTYVHVLAEGEGVTGVTIHEMVERFDAGRIVSQEAVPIVPAMSVAELFTLQSTLAGEMLLHAVKAALEQDAITGVEQDQSLRTYRGEPRASDIRQLRAQGYRLLRLRDLRLVTHLRLHQAGKAGEGSGP